MSDSLLAVDKYNLVIVVPDYKHADLKYFTEINKLAADAEKDSVAVYGMMNIAQPADVEAFRHTAQTSFPFFTADDKLLKTMIRSNPGVFLFKKGTILHKWHRLKLPDYATMRAEYMNKK